MKKLFFIILAIIAILSSCNKNEKDFIIPNGLFKEKSPVENRSQLEFINGNLLIKTEIDSSIKDTFHYEIVNDKIKLKPAWTNEYPASELTFKMITPSKFEIQDLYSKIPESPITFMTFEK